MVELLGERYWCVVMAQRVQRAYIEFEGYQVMIEQKKMKNIYLRVKDDGTLYVTAPRQISKERILQFLTEKQEWIKEHIQEKEKRAIERQKREYCSGEKVWLWGKEYILIVQEYGARSKVFIEENTITLMVPDGSSKEMRKRALDYLYKKELEKEIELAFGRYEPVVGKKHTSFTIRDMKTRWGSCNVKTAHISLNLKLATKPRECLDYVVVHELTHLWEANHGKGFHTRMDLYYPNWKAVKKILNTNE